MDLGIIYEWSTQGCQKKSYKQYRCYTKQKEEGKARISGLPTHYNPFFRCHERVRAVRICGSLDTQQLNLICSVPLDLCPSTPTPIFPANLIHLTPNYKRWYINIGYHCHSGFPFSLQPIITLLSLVPLPIVACLTSLPAPLFAVLYPFPPKS